MDTVTSPALRFGPLGLPVEDAGVDPFDQNIYIGLLIIGAVAFDQKLRKLG